MTFKDFAKAICLVWVWLACLAACNAASSAEITGSDVKFGKCDVVLIGTIERGDDVKFTNELARVLVLGCEAPTVYLYSRGGDVDAAIGIGEQVYALRLETVAPTFAIEPGDASYSPNGPRYCPLLPGAKTNSKRA